jgi:hypothetical protein
MKKTWEKRIRKLESTLRSRPRSSVVFRYGHIRYLPPETGAQRHIAIVKSEPTTLANVEHCEFEERIGLVPEARDDSSFTVYLTAEDENGKSRQCSLTGCSGCRE